MDKQAQMPKVRQLKIVIIILAVLLVISAGGLAARYIYLYIFTPAQTTVTVPDNLIGEESDSKRQDIVSTVEVENSSVYAGSATASEPVGASNYNGGESGRPSSAKAEAAKLELYHGRPDANQKFEVRNMLPGDCVTKYFCVKASHDADIDLFFRTEVTEETKALGDILHIKVTHMETGKVLCDAPFSEIDGQEFSELLTKNAQGETTAYYQIDVSLDTSVGNEYQAAMLKADFAWYVKEEGSLTPPPQTGDPMNLALWAALALSSLILLVLLLLGRRRKEDARHG